MKKDPAIFRLIDKEYQRQLHGIELIASENFVSEQVLQAMGSCLTNKYAEGLPGKRYYGGCHVVDEVEQLAIDRAKELFNAVWVNISNGGTKELGIAVSDETTALSTGTAKVTFRMPYAMTVSEVRASVGTAPTGSVLTVDINESGTSILSTKLTIDATEKTSTTAATPPVISDASLADDAEITVDIDGVGSTVAGAGLKIWLIGVKQ